MKKSIYGELMKANNYSELVNSAKGAKVEMKAAKANIMYWVNMFNKYARKNDIINGVNIKDLGNKVREYSLQHGIEAPGLYNAYIFTKVNGLSCYKKMTHKKASKAFAVDVDITTWQPVSMTENGFINACKAVLSIDAKAADRAAREHNKCVNNAARKAETNAKAAARKTLKAEQKAAREAFAAGKMCMEEFATIMAKAV